MVEIFKTNVRNTGDAARIVENLLVHFPEKKINFDLSDRDRILRVEGETICIEKIIAVLGSVGYLCEILY